MARVNLLGPTRSNDRIAGLDIARGLALFCIFMVNVQVMTQPLSYMLTGGKDEGIFATASYYVTRVLFESKSYPLFSMLFGMGMMLMYDRAKAAGRAFAFPYFRRLLLLLLVGMAHAWLVWYGDILIYYALIGMIVMWLAPLRPKPMLIIAAALVALSAIWASGVMYLIPSLEAETQPDLDVAGFVEFRDALMAGDIQNGPENAAWTTGEIDAFAEGPFLNAIGMRLINWTASIIVWLLLYATFLHVPAMFLLGGALLRSGVLTNPDSKWPQRFMLLGLVVGLPGAIGAVVLSDVTGPTSPLVGLTIGVVHVFGPFMSLGYLGLALWLGRSAVGAVILKAVAAAGRMALTNYLLQSLLVAALAQHWGLGLFGEVSRLAMLGIVFGIYAFQLVFSSLWLSRFTMGPFEYGWRCGIYFKLPKLMKTGG
ncbi:MAG: DUF418 domain-containing protein [Planctomycetota bacterium]